MKKIIIYLSTSCTVGKFTKLQETGINRDVPQAQKYHRLLIEGLASNKKCDVYPITLISTNRNWTKKLIFKKEAEEAVNGLKYIYLPFVNFPIIKQLIVYCSCRREIKRIISRSDNEITYVFCDIWNQTLAKCARISARNKRIKTVGIVTDVPKHRSNAYKTTGVSLQGIIKNIVENNTFNNAKQYDFYLLLTEAMNEVVNPLGKPYVVLEGHSDLKMRDVPNELSMKAGRKILLYAGTLHKEYGIETLIKAFIKTKASDWELHIYGKGNYSDEVKNFCKIYKNIVYFGLVSNDIVTKKQIEATLIVNPRPSNEDFVKYSFPSKTLEAMASGTPLLTTKLPGIPEEYFKYLYTFRIETQDGYKETLDSIMKKPIEDLHRMGMAAKKFAINKKNNCVQASEVINLLEEIM